MSNHNTRHICPLCSEPTQTYHEGACLICKKRIAEQIHRYLPVAAIIHLEMEAMFGVYQTKD